MKIDLKKVLLGILSIAVGCLGGSQYQYVSDLNDVRKDVQEVAELAKALAHHEILQKFEAE